MEKVGAFFCLMVKRRKFLCSGVGKKGVLSCLPAGVFVFSLRMVCRGGVVDEKGCLKVSGR